MAYRSKGHGVRISEINKMRIVLVTHTYPYPDRGFNPGVERVVQEVAKEFQNLGHEVSVITTYRNGGSKKVEFDQGVKIHRIEDSRYFVGRVGSTLSFDVITFNISMFQKRDILESADIIHTFTPIIWKSSSTPIVAHYHHWDEPTSPLEYLYLPSSHQLWFRCYNLADRIIAVSNYAGNDIISRGVDSKKVRVVHNGVNIGDFIGDYESIRPQGWSHVLLYVGPLTERKGIKYLLQSLPSILEEIPDIGLWIVGGGDSNELIEIAKRLGVDDNVKFEGFVPDEDLSNYYQSADVFVFPSLKEGFGMVLLEAMACSLPVVASDTTAIPEVIGSAGQLVPPKDPNSLSKAIREILANPELQQQMESESVNRIKNMFSWRDTTNELLEIYKKI